MLPCKDQVIPTASCESNSSVGSGASCQIPHQAQQVISNLRSATTPKVGSMPQQQAAPSKAVSTTNMSSVPVCGVSQHLNMQYSPVVYAPSYLSTPSTEIGEQDHFWLTFVKGNISRCNGCGTKNLRLPNGQPHPPPDDLCIQHKEQVMFLNPNSGNYQLSCDKRNVYYHARRSCVLLKWPQFNSSFLKISLEAKTSFHPEHASYLLKEFGETFSF